MFESSHPFLVFDELRVPYRIAAVEAPAGFGRLTSGGRSLLWSVGSGVPGAYKLGDIPIHGRVMPAQEVLPVLRSLGGHWRRLEGVRDHEGTLVASVWVDEKGSVLLPFNPDEVIRASWSEAYQTMGGNGFSSALKTAARRAYYRVRPLLPRAAQIRLRRAFTKVQERARFPRWPVEPALHDLQAWVLELAGRVAREPVPRIASWPNGYSWAFVLTHDVETDIGFRNLHLLRKLEEEAGCRSSWNFVARRYDVDQRVVDGLRAAGFEIGVHGLYHDGLDLDSEERLQQRLPEMREWAERWGAVGFRAPALHRNADWMPLLGFDYDSSYPDTDPYEPKAGGCLSWLPFFNGDLVELPVTLSQDHTLFEILRLDERLWLEKTAYLRERGGMALALTHPDYMLDSARLNAYRRFLAEFACDSSAWKALPRDVSAWWRRRAASSLERIDGEWRVVGPAAGEATVELSGVEAAVPEAAVA